MRYGVCQIAHLSVTLVLFCGTKILAENVAVLGNTDDFISAVSIHGRVPNSLSHTVSKPYSGAASVQYCSFFHNRAPTAQPSLRNCTWFGENSCCQQQEIEATFERVRSLQGASDVCQRYMNYLMCYICAPNQAHFYENERLTVCEPFCDALYIACGQAMLKGERIGTLFPNGREFCLSRRFLVGNIDGGGETSGCFSFDITLDVARAVSLGRSCYSEVDIRSLILLLVLSAIGSLSVEQYLHHFTLSRCISHTLEKTFSHVKFASESLLTILYKIVQGRKIIGFCTSVIVLLLLQLLTKMKSLTSWSTAHPLQFFLLSMAFCQASAEHSHSGIMTIDSVRASANSLSHRIMELYADSSGYNRLASSYASVRYESIAINGRKKADELGAAAAKFFERKANIVESLARETARLYSNRTRSSKHHPQNNRTSSVQNLDDLPRSVYMDADKLYGYRLPVGSMYYSRALAHDIMVGQSAVKLPSSVNRSDPQIFDTVNWTAGLDAVFLRNRKEEPSIRWQYFASSSGAFRIYPGIAWRRRGAGGAGAALDYEPRAEPWYLDHWSGARDIVIVIDTSASMAGTSLTRAKDVAIMLLRGLTHRHRVNVVVSASDAFTKDGDHAPGHHRVLGCRYTLSAATPRHRLELINAVRALVAAGGSDHLKGLEAAFNLLLNASTTTGLGPGGRRTGRDGNCRSVVAFITDGKTEDPDIRCTAGFYRYAEDNRKSFIPGERCHYHHKLFVNLIAGLQAGIKSESSIGGAHLFTFVTPSTDSPQHELRLKDLHIPGRLACENNGAMSLISKSSQYYPAMMSYYEFVRQTNEWPGALPVGVYMSAVDAQPTVTISASVIVSVTENESETKRNIGVAGVEVALSEIEDLFYHIIDEGVHAFMVNLDDGSAMIHPRAPRSFEINERSPYVGLAELEAVDLGDKADEFDKVMYAMMSRSAGDVTIFITQTASLRYFFTSIPGTHFGVGVRVHPPNYTYRRPVAQRRSSSDTTDYLHTLLIHASAIGRHETGSILDSALSVLAPNDSGGVFISLVRSVIALSPRSFCNATRYGLQYMSSMIEIQSAMNSGPMPVNSERSDDKICELTTAALRDISLTKVLESAWIKPANWYSVENGLQSDSNGIVAMYAVTPTGVTRVYPGLALPYAAQNNPTAAEWFHETTLSYSSTAAAPKICVTVPPRGGIYHPSTSMRVVTLSKAITSSCVNDTPTAAAVPICSERTAAVLGIDINIDKFHEIVYDALTGIQSEGTVATVTTAVEDHVCGVRYKCQYATRKNETCENRCYLLTSAAELLSFDFSPLTTSKIIHSHSADDQTTHDSHENVHESSRTSATSSSEPIVNGRFTEATTRHSHHSQSQGAKISRGAAVRVRLLKERYEYITKLLLRHKILYPDEEKRSKSHYKCTEGDANPASRDGSQDDCILELVHYRLNHTRLRVDLGGFFSRSLEYDPCNRGLLYITPINETNLALIVISDYLDKTKHRACVTARSEQKTRDRKLLIDPPVCPADLTWLSANQDGDNTAKLFSNSSYVTDACRQDKFIPIPCRYSGSASFLHALSWTTVINVLSILFITSK